MSYIVRLTQGGAPFYTFTTHTPFVDPEHFNEYRDSGGTRRLAAIRKIWTIEGVLYGADEEAVITEWDALKAAIEDPDNHPDGVELVRDAVVADFIGGATFDEFTIENLRTLRINPKRHVRAELAFTMQVTARQVFTDASDISDLQYSDQYIRDDCGLLTRTISGELTTSSGTSARETAESLMTTLLPLPNARFAYIQNSGATVSGNTGPGTVTILNEDDTRASFSISIAESGETLPEGVGPGFSLQTTVAQAEGTTTTTTTVVARGPIDAALAAVRAERPSVNLISETETQDAHRCIASAVYVQQKTSRSQFVRSRSFTVIGGGKPVRHTERTNNRRPARHVLPITETVITETITVEVVGTAFGLAAFTLGKPLELPEDDAPRLTPFPTRVSIGRTPSTDRYRMVVVRVYRTNLAQDALRLPNVLERAVFQVDQSSNVSEELKRGRGEQSGAGGTITAGRIGGFASLSFGGVGTRSGFTQISN